MPPDWVIDWYTTPGGERPLQRFLRGLERDETLLAGALALLELLKVRGNALRPPRSRSLGEGLFELRAHPGRCGCSISFALSAASLFSTVL